MALTFLKIKSFENNSKATIHKSGKLGFNAEAQEKYLVGEKLNVKIALSQEFEDSKGVEGGLFLFVTPLEDEETLPVAKSGDYYYINTKSIFDHYEIDYVKNKIMFDIFEETIDGMDVLKLKRREWEREKTRKK